MNDFANHSLRWKMCRAYQLSSILSFQKDSKEARNTTAIFGQDNSDLIWSHCEGDQFKYYHKMETCRCSLKAAMEFDIGKYEERMEQAIVTFISLLEQVNEEVPEEMTEEDCVESEE
jgi:hypothetical protein